MVRIIFFLLSGLLCVACAESSPSGPPSAATLLQGTYDVTMSMSGTESPLNCPAGPGISTQGVNCSDSIPFTQSFVLVVPSGSTTQGTTAFSATGYWGNGVWKGPNGSLSSTDSFVVNLGPAGGGDAAIGFSGIFQAQGTIAGKTGLCSACRYSGYGPYSGAHGTFSAVRRSAPFLVVTPRQSWRFPGLSVSEAAWFVNSASGVPSLVEPVSWVSRNPNVASVDTNGVVHPLAPGTATIVATTKAQNVSDSAVVVVYGATSPVVTITGDSTTPMVINTRRWLSDVVTWPPQQVRVGGANNVTWTSETPAVATVDAGLVTALTPGVAIIDAQSQLFPTVVTRIRLSVVQPPPPLTFTTVASGGEHACAMTASTKWYCWGWNAAGQIGDGTTTDALAPRLVAAVTNPLVALTAGQAHSCGLDQTGIAYCWGDNSSGQLGGGIPVSSKVTFAKLAAGHSHTCGIAADASVYCWGDNSFGQIGDGTMTNRSAPTLVPGLTATMIAPGVYHTCALTSAGRAFCWGEDDHGELGDGSVSSAPRSAPTAVVGDSTFTTLALGTKTTCGLTPSGTVMCWGQTLWGSDDYGPRPVPIAGAPPFVALAAGATPVGLASGASSMCGLTSAKTVYCWGINSSGELGDGTNLSRATPAPVAGGLTFVALASGNSHVCGLTDSGQAYCWGSNAHGQLGIGNEITQRWDTPIAVLGPLP